MTRGLHSKASLEFTCRRGRFHRQLPRTFVTTAQELRDARFLTANDTSFWPHNTCMLDVF
jgi:hypothetical protein